MYDGPTRWNSSTHKVTSSWWQCCIIPSLNVASLVTYRYITKSSTRVSLLSERSVEKGGRRDDLEVRRAVLLKCMVALQDGSEQVRDHGAAVEDSHVSAHTD